MDTKWIITNKKIATKIFIAVSAHTDEKRRKNKERKLARTTS